jgi:hypothetical protein
VRTGGTADRGRETCATWPRRSLHVERFSPKPLTEPALSGAFEVVLQRSELTLTVPPDRSILSVVEEAGVGVLSSCNEGTWDSDSKWTKNNVKPVRNRAVSLGEGLCDGIPLHPIGVDVRVARRREMHHIGIIESRSIVSMRKI